MTTLKVQWKYYPKTGSRTKIRAPQTSWRLLVKRVRVKRPTISRLRKVERDLSGSLVDVQAETPPTLGAPVRIGELPTEAEWEFAGRAGTEYLAFFDRVLTGRQTPHAWESRAELLRTRTRIGIDQKQLTTPEQLLASLDTGHPDSKTFILFAESLAFDAGQQSRLIPHLVAFVENHRSTSDSDELVALGSAIRKLVAYLPFSNFDSLSDLLGSGSGVMVAKDAELELAKGLVYRMSWDDAVRPECPRLSDDLLELAMFHSSKRVVGSSSSAAIALNASIAIALLGDERAVELATTLPRRSLPWFVSLLTTRVRRRVSKWQKEKRSPDALGRLPDVLDALN